MIQHAYHDITADEALIGSAQDAIETSTCVYFGLRVLPARTRPYRVGERLTPSYNWIDGNRTRQQLNGTSTVGINDNSYSDISRALYTIGHYGYANNVSSYSGDYLALVGGSAREYGDDRGEHILRGAVILAIWPYNRKEGSND